MNDIIEDTPGLNNPETHVSTHKKYNAYKILNFSDLNITMIHKLPHTHGPIHEIEILMSSNYLNVLEPYEDVEVFHFKKPNIKNFLFEIDDRDRIKLYLC